MNVYHPLTLLLLIPMCVWLYHTRSIHHKRVLFLRLLSSLFLLLCVAEPYIPFLSNGIDVAVILDNSASMPADTKNKAKEMSRLLNKKLTAHDRALGIQFDSKPSITHPLAEQIYFENISSGHPSSGSDIPQALRFALNLLPSNRPGRILLLSDGKNTGGDYDGIIREAQMRNIPIHIRTFSSDSEQDISVESLYIPQKIAKNRYFQGTAWIHAPEQKTVEVEIIRDQIIIERRQIELKSGKNRIVFRDQPQGGGIHQYDVRIIDRDDPITQNNTATAGIIVEGKRKILLINNSGQPDEISSILTAHPVRIETPESVNLSPAFLSLFQLVILKDVAALRFEHQELQHLALAVEQDGLGLLMTGGPASFGVGGYIESPIEALLPVYLQTKAEEKKAPVALSIVLDRSCSMGASVGANTSKMELANQGSAAAIALLSEHDEISVFAVDTEPHKIVSLQKVGNQNASISDSVLGIQSDGGGIYVYNGLKAAQDSLKESTVQNRHIILFSDAADSEQPEGVTELIETLRQNNTTISVIALGTPSDPDAAFLIDIATKGGGDIYFSQNPSELPQIFAMDTMLSMRKAYKTGDFPTERLSGLVGMGINNPAEIPTTHGYNASYFKQGAQQGYRLKNEEEYDPLLAFHQYGLGQVGAYLGQVGGSDGQRLTQWPQYPSFFNSFIEGLLSSNMGSLRYMNAQRKGNRILYTIESQNGAPTEAFVRGGETTPLSFIEIQEGVYQAEYDGADEALIVAQVQLSNGETAYLPPIAPQQGLEFQHQGNDKNAFLQLQALALKTDGRINSDISDLLTGSRKGSSGYPLGLHFLLLGLFCSLLEIGQRRWNIFRWPKKQPSSVSTSRPKGIFSQRSSAQGSAPSSSKNKAPLPNTSQEKPVTPPSAIERARKKAARKLDRP